MKITFELVENILKTLPIGYYLVGRQVDVSLSEFSKTSYCIPDKNKIVVAYNNLLDCCKDIEYSDIQSLENDIRCLLYHELSHIILTSEYILSGYLLETPIKELLKNEISKTIFDKTEAEKALTNIKKFIGKSFGTDFSKACRDITNIFEDTRIETILGSYYMNVDFVSFRKRCLGFKPLKKFISWDEEFYWTVRFFYGDKKLVDRVMTIVNNHNKVSSVTDYNSAINYMNDVAELVVDLVLKYYKPTEDSEDSKTPETSKDSGNPDSPAGDDSEVSTDESVEKDSVDNDSEESEDSEESGESIEEVHIDQPELTSEQQESLKKMIKDVFDKKFKQIDETYSTFKTSIDRLLCSAFNKKRIKATSLNGYSGRLAVKNLLNPTNLDNYKWFNKKANDGINNTQFNKIKFNLFIDCSGSFYESMPIINQLIRALIYLESQYKDFEFDVVKIENDVELADKKDRLCVAHGGNRMPDELIGIYNKIQNKNALNYNIVVFDGYALSDSRDRARESRNFRVFNHPNTTIISDKSNEVEIKKFSPNSRNIMVSGYYVERLVENVINTLTGVLR